MRCPSCRTELAPVPLEEEGFWTCPQCAGAWLDNALSGGLVQGLATSVFEQATLRAEASGLRGASDGYRAPARMAGDAARRCAECDEPLVRSVVKNTDIEIDACSRHGAFFDPGELLVLVHHFRAKAATDDEDVRAFSEQIELTRGRRWNTASQPLLLDLVVDVVTWLARRVREQLAKRS